LTSDFHVHTISCEPSLKSWRKGTSIVRILVTVEPRMYREALALSLQRRGQDYEVLVGTAGALDRQAREFRPHLLIRNDTDEADMESHGDVLCWIEILYSDSMSSRVSLDGEVWTIENICLDDLTDILNRIEGLVDRGELADKYR
jgi:hypothetical protein